MSVIGSSRESKRFLENLNEIKLIDVFADLLTLDRHKDIKITDGPGDGGRDIHSIDSEGNKCLTQSKYHSDISKSISTKTLGELVSSMVRLEYKKGIFLTNAKISPAAKRDSLNSYPGYTIDFVDGRELINRVFDNIVLKAIWYDGIAIDKINYAIIFPVIARDLEKDRALWINPKSENRKFSIDLGRTRGQVKFQDSFSSTIVFQRYRPPTIKTISEFKQSQIRMTELVLTGVIHLEDIDAIIKKISEKLISYFKKDHKQKTHFALVFGKPFIVPLSGETSGGRFQFENIIPITIVCHDEIVEYEKNWLLPTRKKKWELPEFFQVSQMDYVRWFNPKFDICLNLSIVCSPTADESWVIEGNNKIFLDGWNKSLFMLVSNNTVEKIQKNDEFKPSHLFSWDLNSTLCAWQHSVFSQPFIFYSFFSDRDDCPPISNEPDETEKQFAIIRKKIENIGGQSISPTKARHMIAVVNSDPFPESDTFRFRSVELAFETESVSTPILPESRQIQFTVCWLITRIKGKRKSLELIIEKIKTKISEEKNLTFDLVISFHTPQEYPDDHYITCHFYYIPKIGLEKTSTLLNNIEPKLILTVNNVELRIKEFLDVRRATKEFWSKVLYVR